MNDKLKLFFKSLKDEDEYQYFLFKKFYTNPKSILNKNENDVENKDYFDNNIVYRYILNNNFLELLKIILYDDNFNNKLTYFNFISLKVLITRSNKIASLKKDKYKNYDFNLSKEVLDLININTRMKYVKEVKYKKIKEDVLFSLEYDKDSTFLYFYKYNTDKVINTLVCENRFLDIVENKLLNRDLDEYTISNIINILLLSNRIKTNNTENVNEILARYKLMKKDYFKTYDIKKSEEITKKLENKLKDIKQTRKIIYFP